jgi:ABC-2 type transport system permease protein
VSENAADVPSAGSPVLSAARALGALLGSEVATIAGLVLYLYVAEPLISRITALGLVAAYLPGVAADGLTQASQAGVRLLPAWQGGLVFTALAAAIAAAGTIMTARRDIT